ncbi:hypothetical protein QTP88_001987 [Uroleucon formosanum]
MNGLYHRLELEGPETETVENKLPEYNDGSDNVLINSEQNFENIIDNLPSTLDYKDPSSWPNLLLDSHRSYIIKLRLNHNENLKFINSEREGRSVTPNWFIKKLTNEQSCRRTWLTYSTSTNSLFCVPCKLFHHSNKTNLSNSKLVTDGFINWKKSSEILLEHENSILHRQNVCSLKSLEISLNTGQGSIDNELQNLIKTEENHWKLILKTIVDVIMHLASEGSAFRGSDELIENIRKSNQSGKFLNLINLISHYNEPLKEHLEHHKKGGLTYFSHGIQNEFLEIISDKIKREIISKIKSTKYYSIIFDRTPDTSHEEQMSKIIRYVVANENGCEIVESFLGFIRVYKKTGEALSEDIINSILQNDLSLNDCRGQSYDNGANMAGK